MNEGMTPSSKGTKASSRARGKEDPAASLCLFYYYYYYF